MKIFKDLGKTLLVALIVTVLTAVGAIVGVYVGQQVSLRTGMIVSAASVVAGMIVVFFVTVVAVARVFRDGMQVAEHFVEEEAGKVEGFFGSHAHEHGR